MRTALESIMNALCAGFRNLGRMSTIARCDVAPHIPVVEFAQVGH